MTWPILPPTLQPKLDTFFWYSSARIWSIFKMDTRMDGSVLAVQAAYQNNLVTSKMMTSQVAEWFPTSTSGKYNSWRKRVNKKFIICLCLTLYVADWDEWNSLPESIHNSAVYFTPKNYITQENIEIFKETVSFHLAFTNRMHFHIFYIPVLPTGH